jgi:hypothetical protein
MEILDTPKLSHFLNSCFCGRANIGKYCKYSGEYCKYHQYVEDLKGKLINQLNSSFDKIFEDFCLKHKITNE